MRPLPIVKALVAAGALVAGNAFGLEIGLTDVTSALTGPLFVQYSNAEQFSATNSIDCGAGCTEGNWGIIQVSVIQQGTALSPTGSDISGGGNIIFADRLSAGFITGIFYGVQVDPSGVTATGGFLDLYWNDCVDAACSNATNVGTELTDSTAVSTNRTAQDQYTGFTDGTLLVHLAFADGVLGDGTGTTVSTGIVPGTGDGTAHSYQNVVLGSGLWQDILNTNYFTLDPNGNPMTARDIRTDSNFTTNGASAWNGSGDIIGLRSNDPVRTFVSTVTVPEPGSLALLGAALIASVGFARRRRGM